MLLAPLALFVPAAVFAAAPADVTEPEYAPPPSWVKPTAIPKADAKSKDGYRVLLYDQQERLTPGGDEYYFETAKLLKTPDGVQSESPIQIAWSPSTDTLVIHKIALIRDGKVIDLLAAGQRPIVLRREQGLEAAQLNGTLTASMQPEGVEVNDILDIAYTLKRHDPVLGGNFNSSIWGIRMQSVKTHVSQSWPSTVAVHWKVTRDLAQPRKVDANGMTQISIDMADAEPAEAPDSAPGRFGRLGTLETSSFSDWQSVSRLMAPYYQSAMALKADSPIRAEAAKIAAASPDPLARASAALALVQQRVRYFYVGLGNGGYVPAAADLTWSRRYGDCKGKTVLLLALLKELGIEAEPALVASDGGDGLDQQPPSLLGFDHVVVRATVAGKVYWLDGTALGDVRIDHMDPPTFEWALPVNAIGATLEALPPAIMQRPLVTVNMEMDLRGSTSVPVPITMAMTMTGRAGYAFARALENMSPETLKTTFTKKFADRVQKMTVTSVDYKVDPVTGDVTLFLKGTAPLNWQQAGNGRRYLLDGGNQDQVPQFEKRADKQIDRDAPMAVSPAYIAGKVTVLLPPDKDRFSVTDGDINETIAGMRLHRATRLTPGKVETEVEFQAVKTEIPYDEAVAARPRLVEMASKAVYLRDIDYQAGADAKAAADTRPKTVDELLTRANDFINRSQYDLAVADMDAAIAIDGKSSRAYADRGIARYHKRDFAGASADFDKAEALDGKEIVWMHGRAMMLASRGDYRGAAAMFGRAIAVDETDRFAVRQRLYCWLAVGEVDKALADAKALEVTEKGFDSAPTQVNILIVAGRKQEASHVLDTYLAEAPDDTDRQLYYAQTLPRVGREGDAVAAFDKALKAGVSADGLASRAEARPATQAKEAEADFQAAIALDPGNIGMRVRQADWLDKQGRHEEALAIVNAIPLTDAARVDLLLKRAEVAQKAGRTADMTSSLAAAQAAAKGPDDFNGLCWWKATHRVELESALADCDTALRQAPDAAPVLDSRAFALLQLGRNEEARKLFDGALSRSPFLSASLYARGIARERLGDVAGGKADLMAARNLSPGIDDRYKDYGIAPPNS